MVLSNKERQARYREALKARAARAPVTEADREFAERRVASYRKELATIQSAIAKIDEGMRFYAGSIDQPIHDVTDQILVDQERRIEMFDDLIRVWSGDLDEPG